MVKQVLRIAAAAVLEDNLKKTVTFWIHRIDIETCSTKKGDKRGKVVGIHASVNFFKEMKILVDAWRRTQAQELAYSRVVEDFA